LKALNKLDGPVNLFQPSVLLGIWTWSIAFLWSSYCFYILFSLIV